MAKPKLLVLHNNRIGDTSSFLFVLDSLAERYDIDIVASKGNRFVFDHLKAHNKIRKIWQIDFEQPYYNSYRQSPKGFKFFVGLYLWAKGSICYLWLNRHWIIKLRGEKYNRIVNLSFLQNFLFKFLIKPTEIFMADDRVLFLPYFSSTYARKIENQQITKTIAEVFEACLQAHLSISPSIDLPISPDPEAEKASGAIVFHIGASYSGKRMSDESIVQLVKRLAETDRVILIDDPLCPNLNKAIYGKLPSEVEKITSSKSLPQLAYWVRKSKFWIAFDGGAAHYFMPFAKGVVLFGPQNPIKSRPYNGQLSPLGDSNGRARTDYYKSNWPSHDELVFYQPDLACRPCTKPACPNDHFAGISADYIVKQLSKYGWLDDASGRRLSLSA